MARLNVLIMGAGIGGSALAFWLAKLNHNVTVVERHPCLRINGLQIDLRGFGIEVMKRMGLEKVVRSKLVPEEGWAIVDHTGREWAFFPANKSGKGAQTMTSEFEIMRCDLCQILHDAATEKGAKYVFGTYLESFEERNGLVNVKFSDGKTDSFDLVVGADGLGSRLRRLMLAESNGASKDALVDLNERTAYFTIPKSIEEGDRYIASGYMLPEKRFVLTRRHNPTEMQVYLKCETNKGPTNLVKTMRRGDVKAEKDAFAEMFQGCGQKTDELIKAMQEGADDWYCQYTGFVKNDRWSKGHVTLVGDAAHGTPADGQGTSAALVGAYVLAGEIERHYGTGDKAATTEKQTENDDNDQLLTAIEAYEHKLQPFIKQIHGEYSAEPGVFDRIPWTSFTVSFFLYIAWFIALLRLDLLLARFMPMEGVKNWDLPEYDMIKF